MKPHGGREGRKPGTVLTIFKPSPPKPESADILAANVRKEVEAIPKRLGLRRAWPGVISIGRDTWA